MNAVLISASSDIEIELGLILRCRWLDTTVRMVAGTFDAFEAIESADIVFVDIEYLGHRASGLIHEISRIWPGPIVAFRRDEIDVEIQIAALRSGADDVWPSFPPDTALTLARTQALLRRARGGELIQVGRLRILPEAQEVRIDGKWTVPLTPTEYRLLEKLAINRNHIVQFDDLLASVWPDDVVDRSTVRKCVQRVRNKLESRSGIEIISRPGVGYILQATTRDGLDDSTSAAFTTRSQKTA